MPPAAAASPWRTNAAAAEPIVAGLIAEPGLGRVPGPARPSWFAGAKFLGRTWQRVILGSNPARGALVLLAGEMLAASGATLIDDVVPTKESSFT